MEAARACQLSGHRAIFLTRYPEQLPPSLPKEVKHFSYIPLSQLLPHAAVLIHHGNIGTCSQALRAGIPQIIQPLAFDQFDQCRTNQTIRCGNHHSETKVQGTHDRPAYPRPVELF